ncbi:hypothetical protein [Frankia sp. Cr1]|uniref:hypothetical protein n=1 Tax=Frankia sp. Cr1 TaxID=3073931 RepID=UPI002AD4675A|nr:hypothetical protein [Frankia sp. Cr1]
MTSRVAIVAPDRVPEIFAGGYADACAALDLPAVGDGYVLHLIASPATRWTVVTRDAGRVSAASEDGWVEVAPAGEGRWVDVRNGWPEEFDPGPRCQFCGDQNPAWTFPSVEVEVLLGAPSWGEHEVLDAEVGGRTDWHACDACRGLIDAGDWVGLVDRYGELGAPPAVQAAWRQFWAHRTPAQPAPALPWTVVRRRRIAYAIRAHWDTIFDHDDLPVLAPTEARDAVAQRVLDAARRYLRSPPARTGWVRSYPTCGTARLLCVEGDGWNLVARTDASAYLLTDALPNLIVAVDRGPRLPALLSGLDAIAERRGVDGRPDSVS